MAKKNLHIVPDESQGWMLKNEDSTEPEGYYDTQEDAITAGRELAGKLGVDLFIHGPDGKLRDSEK